MAFVNEKIPEADFEKYGLRKIDYELLSIGKTYSRDWTIDRVRDIYLREVAMGRDEESHLSTWTFYWKGAPLSVEHGRSYSHSTRRDE